MFVFMGALYLYRLLNIMMQDVENMMHLYLVFSMFK